MPAVIHPPVSSPHLILQFLQSNGVKFLAAATMEQQQLQHQLQQPVQQPVQLPILESAVAIQLHASPAHALSPTEAVAAAQGVNEPQAQQGHSRDKPRKRQRAAEETGAYTPQKTHAATCDEEVVGEIQLQKDTSCAPAAAEAAAAEAAATAATAPAAGTTAPAAAAAPSAAITPSTAPSTASEAGPASATAATTTTTAAAAGAASSAAAEGGNALQLGPVKEEGGTSLQATASGACSPSPSSVDSNAFQYGDVSPPSASSVCEILQLKGVSLASLRRAVFNCLRDLRSDKEDLSLNASGSSSAGESSGGPSGAPVAPGAPGAPGGPGAPGASGGAQGAPRAAGAGAPGASGAPKAGGAPGGGGGVLGSYSMHILNVMEASELADLAPYAEIFSVCLSSGLPPRSLSGEVRQLMKEGLKALEKAGYCVHARHVFEEYRRLLATLKRRDLLLAPLSGSRCSSNSSSSSSSNSNSNSNSNSSRSNTITTGCTGHSASSSNSSTCASSSSTSSRSSSSSTSSSNFSFPEAPATAGAEDARLADLWAAAYAEDPARERGPLGSPRSSSSSSSSNASCCTFGRPQEYLMHCKGVILTQLRSLRRLAPIWASRDRAYQYHLETVLGAQHPSELSPYLNVLSALEWDPEGRHPVSAASLLECLRELHILQCMDRREAQGPLPISQGELLQCLSAASSSRRLAEGSLGGPLGFSSSSRKAAARAVSSTPTLSTRGQQKKRLLSAQLAAEISLNLQRLSSTSLSSLFSSGRGGGPRGLGQDKDTSDASLLYAEELLQVAEGDRNSLQTAAQQFAFVELQRLMKYWAEGVLPQAVTAGDDPDPDPDPDPIPRKTPHLSRSLSPPPPYSSSVFWDSPAKLAAPSRLPRTRSTPSSFAAAAAAYSNSNSNTCTSATLSESSNGQQQQGPLIASTGLFPAGSSAAQGLRLQSPKQQQQQQQQGD
ncbi:hypothetical protein, conserved [Eimeria acervulina]|uniref:Uncharacterized protein n=1 Tax=Eimeria acervulina TaxID=5801 RepID=U6GCV5_EIMAC|nr:hypothetical protein, conserved [Eimeria acervulina]CDI77980.1 hypothetical protein, conserved [Eimeria acervulina]